MTRWKALCWTALLLVSGCKLINTEDSEGSVGVGAKAIAPYQSIDSGALKLSLQSFNGCAILASGAPISPGSLNIPYPASCANFLSPDADPYAPPFGPAAPTATMRVVLDQPYFLNQLTLEDQVVNKHTDPTKLADVFNWMSTQSRFKYLDWGNIGVFKEDWTVVGAGIWTREIFFSNANWMQPSDDEDFLVELLDSADTVRASVHYAGTELLGESSTSGHTRVSWRAENVLPPEFPGDNTIHPTPDTDNPPLFRTTVRVDRVGSTNPFKTITPNFTGTGYFRVTWNKMPDHPFYFPVEVVKKDALPNSCFTPDGTATQCGFGLDPEVHLSRPENGTFYQPGEAFDLMISIRDQAGNQIHPKGLFPSYADFLSYSDDPSGGSNGLLYRDTATQNATLERDQGSAYMIAGPIQDLRHAEPLAETPVFRIWPEGKGLANPNGERSFLPGLFEAKWTSRIPVQLPEDAKPGTYVAIVKAHRQFFGERTSKTNAFFFQVGQAEATSYPNRVGNCQICHRGVLSLDNLRHGLSANHVEACKTCHGVPIPDDAEGRISQKIHQIHFRSPKYPLAKNDCTVCHLTRESATRPSLDTCTSCHPVAHGTQYFQLQFATGHAPNRYGNCAQSCHAVTPPTQHILPSN